MAVTECCLWVAYGSIHTSRSNIKKLLAGDEKKELLKEIEPFKNYYVPLIVLITLKNYFIRKYNESYLQRQDYLLPHPTELKL